MVPAEFQAIVLAAGQGSRFPDIAEGRPKALLPVGPFPVIFYPLFSLQKHGFTEAIVVVLESQKGEIAQKVDKIPLLTMKLDYVTIPNDSEFGTADTLRHITDKVKSDLFIISCDTVTNANLFPMINKYRERDATLVALMLHGGQDVDVILPGVKPKSKPDRDIIMTTLESSRLLFLASLNDFEDELKIPRRLIQFMGKVEANSKILDAHVYIMKKWVLDFIAVTDYISIKDKLIPYMLERQLKRPPPRGEPEKPVMSDYNVSTKVDDIFNFIPPSPLETKGVTATHFGETKYREDIGNDLITCYAYKTPKEIFGLRVNNLRSFVAANRNATKFLEELLPDTELVLVSPTAKVESKQVTDCIVGENTVISPRTSIKTSTFGSNCTVDNKVRMMDCIVLNNVQIGEGVYLENCVIADKVKIEANTTLKNCVVGTGYVVEEGTHEAKVSLKNSDLFMEI